MNNIRHDGQLNIHTGIIIDSLEVYGKTHFLVIPMTTSDEYPPLGVELWQESEYCETCDEETYARTAQVTLMEESYVYENEGNIIDERNSFYGPFLNQNEKALLGEKSKKYKIAIINDLADLITAGL